MDHELARFVYFHESSFTIEDIVCKTGWDRTRVEVGLYTMRDRGYIRQRGPHFEVVLREF